jgi:hypothetical protein
MLLAYSQHDRVTEMPSITRVEGPSTHTGAVAMEHRPPAERVGH